MAELILFDSLLQEIFKMKIRNGLACDLWQTTGGERTVS
jgi:hypothetical protein